MLVQGQKRQTDFGSESEIVRPVAIPQSFFRSLSPEDRRQLRKCQSDDEFNLRKERESDHFVGSTLNLTTRRGRIDVLVVQARSICFMGAHNTRFWMLVKKRGASTKSYVKMFEMQADGFYIGDSTKRDYPELSFMSHTAIENFTNTFSYIRGRYRNVSCYARPNGDESNPPKRIRCSQYKGQFREQ